MEPTAQAYVLQNRTDLAIRMNPLTGEAHVLIETQKVENDVELTEYWWVPVKEEK